MTESPLVLVAILGASEAEIPVLAELHRNRRVHVIGIYDHDPSAIGLELAEILGIRHSADPNFLGHLASAQQVILPRNRHQYADEIKHLREKGIRLLNPNEALGLYAVDKVVESSQRTEPPADTEDRVHSLERAVEWLNRALDREELLRSLLSIGIQSVRAQKGSVMLLDPLTRELYIGYAEGLSEHTVRATRQKLGEGIAGGVAQSRRGRLIQGHDPAYPNPDRSDLLSAISVPLEYRDQLLGVMNVSSGVTGARLGPADLDVLTRIAQRMSPVLYRLLEIQSQHERALVDELESEFERLIQLDAGLEESLGLARDLFQDLSGARTATLVVLTPDGPATRIMQGRDEEGRPRSARDVEADQGILGQVLLGHDPVILDEKIRPAGQTRVHRHLTLYLPMGEPDAFALFIAHFDSLSVLSHFQRNMDQVLRVLSPRIGALLARDETQGRLERLRFLTSGLGSLAGQSPRERWETVTRIAHRQTGAQAVALWLGPGAEPTTVLQVGELSSADLSGLWSGLRERVAASTPLRTRELDQDGSGLRSVLAVGERNGPLLIAINRVPARPLEELGFREEDQEALTALVDAVTGFANAESTPPPPLATEAAPSIPDDVAGDELYQLNRRLLREAAEREWVRAQRYHFGFSLTLFEIDLEEGRFREIEEALRHRLGSASRSTDCLLWTGPQRFAVLAPEEARGVRRLAKRLEALLEEFLEEHRGDVPARVRVGAAAYPHDADSIDALFATCEGQLARDPD